MCHQSLASATATITISHSQVDSEGQTTKQGRYRGDFYYSLVTAEGEERPDGAPHASPSSSLITPFFFLKYYLLVHPYRESEVWTLRSTFVLRYCSPPIAMTSDTPLFCSAA